MPAVKRVRIQNENKLQVQTLIIKIHFTNDKMIQLKL